MWCPSAAAVTRVVPSSPRLCPRAARDAPPAEPRRQTQRSDRGSAGEHCQTGSPLGHRNRKVCAQGTTKFTSGKGEIRPFFLITISEL